MLVLIHVSIALASLVYTGYLNLFPAKSKFNAAYALIAGTLISGTALVIARPAHILSVCESGLIYLGVASLGIATAHRRLAKETSKNDTE